MSNSLWTRGISDIWRHVNYRICLYDSSNTYNFGKWRYWFRCFQLMMILDIEITSTYGRHCSGTNAPREHIWRTKGNPPLLQDQRTWYSLCLQSCKHLRWYFSPEDLFQNVFETKSLAPSLGQVFLPEIICSLNSRHISSNEILEYSWISSQYFWSELSCHCKPAWRRRSRPSNALMASPSPATSSIPGEVENWFNYLFIIKWWIIALWIITRSQADTTRLNQRWWFFTFCLLVLLDHLPCLPSADNLHLTLSSGTLSEWTTSEK